MQMDTKSDIPVGNIMSTNIKTLHPKDKIQRAKDIFSQYEIHHIPVAVMGEIRGIISLGDLLFLEGMTNNSFDKFLRSKKYEMSTVDEIMTPRPYCIEVKALLSEVMDIMISKRVNCLPVIENDEMVGIVTNYDLMKYFRNLINRAQ